MTLEDIIAAITGGGQAQMQPAAAGQTPNDLVMSALGAPNAAPPPPAAFGMRRADSPSVTQSGFQSVGPMAPPQASQTNAAPAPSAPFPEGRAENTGLSFLRPPEERSPIAPPSSRVDSMLPQRVPEPTFGDRAAAYVDGAAKHGLLGGFVDAFTAPDAAAKAKREQIQQTNATYRALVAKGMTSDEAFSVVSNKDLTKEVVPAMFGKGQQTDLVKNFEYAKRAGFEGTLVDFMRANKSAEGGNKFGLNPQYGIDEATGEPALIQLNTDGTSQRTAMPPGIKLSKEPIKLDAGTEWVLLDPITRQPVGRQSKNVAAEAAAKEGGTAQGKAQFDLPRVESAAKRMTDQVDAVLGDKRLGNVTGWQARLPTLNPKNVDVEERIAQLGGGAFLQAFESLKGGGQITEVEGEKATKALARLTNLRQSDGGFKTALEDFKAEVKSLADLARKKAGGTVGLKASTSDAPRITGNDDFAALPSGAVFIDPNGQQRRKP